MKLRVGLDIGTTKIIAIIGYVDEKGSFKVIDFARNQSVGIVEGAINNISKTIQSIRKTILELEKKIDKKVKKVSVGIAGRNITNQSHSDYILRKSKRYLNGKRQMISDSDLKKIEEQIKSIVVNPDEEIIHIYPQTFKVDGQKTEDPIGMNGDRLDGTYHVVSAKTNAIENIRQCIEGSGLLISQITLESIASASAILTNDELEAGVAIVDIGGGTTDIAVFKENVIRYTAVIPFGGNRITKDIEDEFGIMKKYAEELKIGYGSIYNNKSNSIVEMSAFGDQKIQIELSKLSEVIKSSIKTNIVDKIYNQFKLYGCDKKSNKLIAGIVLTGGGSKLKGIKQFVNYVTGIQTRLGYNKVSETISGDKEVSCPSFSTSIGLLIQDTMGGAEKQINKQSKFRKLSDNIIDRIKNILLDE